MKRFWLGIAASVALSACGGDGTNPFTPDDGSEDPVVVPEALSGDLTAFSYDPVAKTLSIDGVSLDNTPYSAVYRRRPGLDVDGYEAYTAQEGSLQRHYTAYVQEIDNTRAAIVVSGGQFSYYFGGSSYGRDGDFNPPTTTQAGGLVSYAGNYVGLLNISGDGGDLLPVDPGTADDVRPRQAAEVTGSILINADFADNSVNGVVYDRTNVDTGTSLSNLDLVPTTIETNGSFTGEAAQDLVGRGTYGGIFGGTEASAVAGTLFVENHIDGIENEAEFGLFVLPKCGTPNADALCDQPRP